MASPLQPIDGYPPTSLLLFLQSAPPPVIFVAFQADCSARGIQWYSTEGQIFAVNLFLKHPVSHRYPPRASTLRSFLKQYISLIEQPHIMNKVMEANGGLEDPIQLDLMEALIALNMSRNDKESSTCYKTFFNPYLERNIRRASSTALSVSNSEIGTDTSSTGSKRDRERIRRERRETMAMFCPIRVSTEQFRNVGLSLWPAAFVLVQLLAQEIKGITHILTEHLFPTRTDWDVVSESSSSDDDEDALLMEGLDDEDEDDDKAKGGATVTASKQASKRAESPRVADRRGSGVGAGAPAARSSSAASSSSVLQAQGGVSLLARTASTPSCSSPPKLIPEKDKLHFLELGAGVGMTPILLHRIRSYKEYVANFTVTDYQAKLTENITYNLKSNKVTTVSDYEAAAYGLEGRDKAPPYHMVSLLDWNDDPLTQQSQFLSWRSDVILAADCIYDVTVIPGLVSTIKNALTMHYTTTTGGGAAKATVSTAAAVPSSGSQSGPPPPLKMSGSGSHGGPHPQRRLSRHVPSGVHRERSKGDADSERVAPPYDPLFSSADSFMLDGSYDLGIDLGTQTPSLRSPAPSNVSVMALGSQATSGAHSGRRQSVGASSLTATTSAAEASRRVTASRSLTSVPPPTPQKKRVCIVVQTHRQASTMKIFFDAVREFATVKSYVLERMPVLNLESQLSKGRDCKDGGVVPIGDYNPNRSESVFENRDGWVCALRPDVVLPDGNLKSVIAKAEAERAASKNTGKGKGKGNESAKANNNNSDTASWQGSIGSAPGTVMSGGGSGAGVASWGAVSSFSTFTTADVEAILKDEMIGPFFTSMAGLIGVHVITLKD